MSSVQLFFKETLSKIKWTDHSSSDYMQSYYIPMMKNGSNSYVSNVNCKLGLLQVNEIFIPFTVGEREFYDSYVTSVFAFLPYAKEEVERHCQIWHKWALIPILGGVKTWLKKANINQTVYVNNSLISTNLYDDLSSDDIKAIHFHLIKTFPRHTLLFRSLNPYTEQSISDSLTSHQYQHIVSRSVYFFDPKRFKDLKSKKRCEYFNDSKLVNNPDIEWIKHEELTLSDMPRIKELYDMLYLQKYSKYNPQYTVKFFENALLNRTFELTAIRYKGKLVGVTGYFVRRSIMANPILGYDISLPQSLGLYRMLTAYLITISLEKGYLYHLSSGVGTFKRNRGCFQILESMAVYTKHLPFSRRLPWLLFRLLLNGVGKRILIKRKL